MYYTTLILNAINGVEFCISNNHKYVDAIQACIFAVLMGNRCSFTILDFSKCICGVDSNFNIYRLPICCDLIDTSTFPLETRIYYNNTIVFTKLTIKDSFILPMLLLRDINVKLAIPKKHYCSKCKAYYLDNYEMNHLKNKNTLYIF